MIVEIRMFAVARQLAGCDPCRVEVADEATVADLREALLVVVPELAGMVAQIRFAVNAEYASDTTRLQAGDEVALIPPVSGG